MYKCIALINASSAVILLASCFSGIKAVKFPQACDKTTWSRSLATWSLAKNVNRVSTQEREVIAKLRCFQGCQFAVRI